MDDPLQELKASKLKSCAQSLLTPSSICTLEIQQNKKYIDDEFYLQMKKQKFDETRLTVTTGDYPGLQSISDS